MATLQEKAMIVRLKISLWTAMAVDSSATQEAHKAMNAAADAGKYKKYLVKCDELKKLRRSAYQVRRVVKELTLPWYDDGARLLTASAHMDFVKKVRKTVGDFTACRTNFIGRYSEIKAESKKRLGKMFDETEFPTKENLEAAFNVTYKIENVPSADDFRVAVSAKDAEEIRAQIEEDVQKQVTVGMKDLWVRLKDALSHVTEKLSDKESVFRDSLIGNVKSLCETLPKLNLTNDKEFDAIVKEVQKTVATLAPETLRKDAKVRKATVDKTTEILDKMKGYGI